MDEEISYTALAVFPPEKIREKISKLSKEFAVKYNSWWTLDPEKFPPHITLWLAYVPTKNLERIDFEVVKIVKDIPKFKLIINGMCISKDGYVTLNIMKTKELIELHNVFIKKLNKWREGYLHPKYKEKFNEYSKETQESLKNYGTRFAGQLFNPHITVTVIEKENIEKIKTIFPEINESFYVDETVFFKEAESGKSIDIISTYKLNKI